MDDHQEDVQQTMGDHQEDVLQTMTDVLVYCSRGVTCIAFVLSVLAVLQGDISQLPLRLWPAACVTHGLALLLNGCVHVLISGDRDALIEARCFATLNAVVLVAIAMKFA